MSRSILPVSAFLFTLGLLGSSYLDLSFWTVFLFASFFCLLGFCLKDFHASGLLLVALLFFLGILRGELASSKSPQHLTHFMMRSFESGFVQTFEEQREPVHLRGIVLSDSVSNGKTHTFDLRCLALKEGPVWRSVSGKLRVFAEGHPAPLYGEEIMVEGLLRSLDPPGNPGEFDFAAYLKRRKIDGTLQVKSHHGLLSLGKNHGSFFSRNLRSLRRESLQKIDRFLSKEEAALFGAMVLGDRSKLDGEVWDLFARTGTVHLLSISGLHVGILAALLYFLWRLFRLRRGVSFSLTLLFLVTYATLVGGSPPVVRATVMIGLYLLGSLLGREVLLLNVLSLAYLSLLLWNPLYLFEPGFQLSFLSVFFIFAADQKYKIFLKEKKWFILDPRGSRKHRPLKRRLLDVSCRLGRSLFGLLIVSMGIWIGIWPIVAYHFYLVSPVSWIANLFVIPLLFPIAGVGVFWLCLGQVLPSVSESCLFLEGILLSFLIWVARILDRIPLGSFHLSIPGIPFLFLYYVALGIFLLKKLQYFRWPTLLCILALLHLCIWGNLLKGESQDVEVTFLDVGHGEAIFIELPGKRNLLIDGGDRRDDFDAGRRIIAPFLWKRNIRRLDAVILTHADRDHVGGILEVIRMFRPRYVFESGFPKESAAYQAYRDSLEKLGLDPILLHRGQKIAGYQNVSLEVLHPPRPFLTGTERDENNNGVVLKLVHGDIEVLLTADIQEAAISDLLASGENLQADVLKMPHHGGELGKEAAQFLKAVSPKIAVISVGEKGAFHLPSSRTISLLDRFGIPTYQTVHAGAIRIVSDGEHLRLFPWREANKENIHLQ